MAQMNELLEQAVGECENLTKETDTLIEVVGQVIGGAGELASRVEEEGVQTSKNLVELAAMLSYGENGLKSRAENARSQMDSLQKRAEEVESKVQGMLEGVEQSLKELAEQKSRLSSSLRSAHDKAEDDLEKLAVAVKELEDAAVKQLAEAEKTIDTFKADVDTIREAFHDKKDEIKDAIEALENRHRERLEGLVEDFDELVGDGEAQVNELQEKLNQAAEQWVETLMAMFTETVPEALEDVFDTLKEGFELFERVQGASEELIGGVGEVTDKADEFMKMMETIEPLVERVTSLLD